MYFFIYIHQKYKNNIPLQQQRGQVVKVFKLLMTFGTSRMTETSRSQTHTKNGYSTWYMFSICLLWMLPLWDKIRNNIQGHL